MSSFQHQTKRDVEQQRVGIVQSVPVTHSSLMQVVGRSVASASGDDEGALTLVFDDGQVVRFIEERIPYESYTFKDGDRVRCCRFDGQRNSLNWGDVEILELFGCEVAEG